MVWEVVGLEVWCGLMSADAGEDEGEYEVNFVLTRGGLLVC